MNSTLTTRKYLGSVLLTGKLSGRRKMTLDLKNQDTLVNLQHKIALIAAGKNSMSLKWLTQSF